ncbi:MAG: hypothetical protein IKX03_01860, partial [Bacteroidales bacterium]|nr:hypothetical protein [Bacteroidales bacterium]
MKKVLFALAVAVMAFGCTKVDEGGIPVLKNTIRVSSDEATRTQIVTDDDVTFRHNWEAGDAIALFDAKDILKYEIVGEGGSTVADFTGEEPVKQQPPYYAIYPYKDNIDIYNDATNQSKFLYNYPEEIEYDGKTMVGSNVMIGFTDGKSLGMKNACSYVCLRFSTPFLCFVNSIEITAKGGEALAGPHLIGIDANGVPFTEVFDASACSSTVKVTFPESLMLTANTEVFYIPLPAVDLSAGLSFVLNGDFGGEPSLNLTSSGATLERNTVLVMEEYRLPSEEARIGDVIYETVADAFKAANASDEDVTITLLRSCLAGERLTIGNGGTGDVTLNLNGKTLTTTANNYVLANGRNLTVTDLFSDDPEKQGTITTDSGNTSQYVVRVENSGNLNWLKGNLTCTEYRPLYITSNSTATLSGGTIKSPKGIAIALGSSGKSVTIDGDVLVEAPTNNAVYLWGGNLYVFDGYITNGSGSAVYSYGANAVAVVSGGYIDGFAANPVSAATGGAKAYVTGGCFTKANFSIYTVDPDGNVYLNDLNPDPETNEVYPFMVVPKTGEPVAHGARTSGTPYWDFASIESAVLSAATTPGANSLTLLQDVSTDVTLDFANTYATTFDLNGKKITSSASPAVVNSKGTLTILDGSEAATGEVSTTGATALEVKGTVNFNGGSLAAANNAIAVDGGKLKVLNGWFYGGTSDITGSGDITLSSGYFKNKPDASIIEEDNAAMALSPAENHNGRDYNWMIKRGYTILVPGANFNMAIKSLANGTSVTTYTYHDAAITKIVFKENADLSGLEGVDVSSLKDGSIIATFDSGVITVSTNYPDLRCGESLAYMFRDFFELTSIEGFDLVDTRLATTATGMFRCSGKLETVDVSKMKTSNITDMSYMFCDDAS